MKRPRGSLLKRRYIVYKLQVFLITVSIATTLFGAVATSLALTLIHESESIQPKYAVLSILAGSIIYFSLISIFVSMFTNRLFGPIFRIHESLKGILRGERVGEIRVRKDDYFQEIVTDFNRLVTSPTSKPPDDSQESNEKGFTLVELVGLIAILGLLATMSAGAINGWIQRSHLALDQSVINEALTKARDLARSRHECVVVEIAEPTVTIEAHLPNASTDRCTKPLGLRTQSLPLSRLNTDTTVDDFSNGSNSLIFSGSGAVADGTVTQLKISNASRSGTFTIYPAIGLIRYR